jgi:hypothetical protein
MAEEEIPWVCGPGEERIGAPSAGLSLGGLHACRAHLRFTRHLSAYRSRPRVRKVRDHSMWFGSG